MVYVLKYPNLTESELKCRTIFIYLKEGELFLLIPEEGMYQHISCCWSLAVVLVNHLDYQVTRSRMICYKTLMNVKTAK